jgi:hypothetical protein
VVTSSFERRGWTGDGARAGLTRRSGGRGSTGRGSE